jgi:hypothetical protein
MSRSVRPILAVLTLVGVVIGGCASTQLNYNTLDLAASLDSLTTKQILFNLARTLEDPYAVPSEITVAAGSATTANSITPTFSTPLSGSTTATSTSFSVTHPNGTASVGASDQWQQGWTLDPITNPDEIRRLRALYRYAIGWIRDDQTFKCEYPVQSGANLNPKPRKYTLNCTKADGGGVVIEEMPDPAFLVRPSCVLCSDGSSLTVNENLRRAWVHGKPSEGTISLGSYGSSELFVCGNPQICGDDGIRAFHEFELFVFEATAQSGGSSSPGKNPTIKALGAPAPVFVTPGR